MPLYDYKCTQCGKISEVRHGFDEAHADPCPACGGNLVRVFNPAPIVFKGSGFYVTDSRKAGAAAASAAEAPKADAAKTDAPKSDAAAKTELPKPGGPSVPAPKSDAKASEPAA
jgi:putative FmdB family regulatory protein